jgi:hypothetical protein
MRVWNIEQDRENGGRIVRTALPRFRARWITGDDLEEIAALPGPCWSDSGSGSGEAAREIDAWIAGRL